MHTITKEALDKPDNLSNSTYLFDKTFLIFDIETTGFSRENEMIYMIGCIYKNIEGYFYYNFFAQDPSQEQTIIKEFFKLLKDMDCLIHFNGNRFDIPFLLARSSKYNIKDKISHIESIDIYDLLRPFRKNLHFPNLKLDTIQKELGYIRKDTYTGGDLIQVYHNYVKNPYDPYYELLLLHNKEDVEGMINLLPIIDVINLIDNIIQGQDNKILSISHEQNQVRVLYELPSAILMDFKLAYHHEPNIVLQFDNNSAELSFPLYKDNKKYFFDNYKDYVYLPDKDEVIHKSLASFIPANKRKRANKGNCYVSQSGVFAPVLCKDFKTQSQIRIFKDNLRCKKEYVLVSEELDTSFYKKQISGFLKECKKGV